MRITPRLAERALPRYVQAVDSKGRTYLYFRRGSRRTRLPDDPSSSEFFARYAELLGSEQRPSSAARPGSVRELIARYKASPEWAALAANTRADYARMLDRMQPIGEDDVKAVRRRHIRLMRDEQAKTPRAANVFVQVVRRAFEIALDDGDIEINPAAKIKPLDCGESYRAWSAEDCATFEAAEVPAWARTAYMLGRYTGQRRGDLLHMSRAHYDGRRITVAKQEKTAARVVIPCHHRLKAYLDAQPRETLLFVTTTSGMAWDKRNFSKALRSVLNRIGLPHLHLHGLRHTAAIALAEAGCSEEEIKSITGHKSSSSVAVYVAQARQTLIAESAIAKLERTGTEQETGKPARRTGKLHGDE